MGPLMIDVHGTSLSAEDKNILEHPLVGGLILFTRNYESPAQLASLTDEIRDAARNDIIIAVDHEGGRVQRFRQHFSEIPAMGAIWQRCQHDIKAAQQLAKHCGVLMAVEVLATGIDISFAPVLDVHGISDVIGDRAFHVDPDIVKILAAEFISGMQSVGMKTTGKHFPGHGSVKEDSHVALPIDTRSGEVIFSHDMLPFKQLIAGGQLDAIMPAHIIFPAVDRLAVGFSPVWLQQILRQQLGFSGVIFSDDLTMAGAASIGGYVERAEAAQQAGCDMLLVCNSRQATVEIIDQAKLRIDPVSQQRLHKLLKNSTIRWTDLATYQPWLTARAQLARYR